MVRRAMQLCAGVLLAVAAASTLPAAATVEPDPATPQPVASGIDVAALPGAAVTGTTPAGTRETVSFILRERNAAALAAAAQAGLRHYLPVAQFASSYGQTPVNLAALTSYLAGYGIATTVYPDKIDVVATGTAGEFDRALSVTQQQYRVPAHGTVRGNVANPLLPYRLSSFLLAVLGLSTYAPYADDLESPVTTQPAQPGRLPSDFAATYGLDPLYRQGATGTGQTAGVVALAAVDPGAPQHFWQQDAHVTRTGSLTVDTVDGGPGAPSRASGSAGTDADIEQAGAVAPGADVIAYAAPDTDAGYADALFTAASQDTASTVAASWGQSEAFLPAGFTQVFDEAFAEMAVQGQSAFVASGDCGARDSAGQLSVDTPADSPLVTAAGGTTLPWAGTLTGAAHGAPAAAPVSVPSQRIWGWDYLWPAVAATTGVTVSAAAQSRAEGSGGGFSQSEPAPRYQQGVPGTQIYHAVPYPFDPITTVTSGTGSGRALPDIVADADPQTGYLVYGASAGGLGTDGGTGFVAQQLGGTAAVIDSWLGHRAGLWNPVAYAAAAGRRNPFTPLDQAGPGNDDLYYTGNPGDRFSPGAGLGVPNLAELAGDFPR